MLHYVLVLSLALSLTPHALACRWVVAEASQGFGVHLNVERDSELSPFAFDYLKKGNLAEDFSRALALAKDLGITHLPFQTLRLNVYFGVTPPRVGMATGSPYRDFLLPTGYVDHRGDRLIGLVLPNSIEANEDTKLRSSVIYGLGLCFYTVRTRDLAPAMGLFEMPMMISEVLANRSLKQIAEDARLKAIAREQILIAHTPARLFAKLMVQELASEIGLTPSAAVKLLEQNELTHSAKYLHQLYWVGGSSAWRKNLPKILQVFITTSRKLTQEIPLQIRPMEEGLDDATAVKEYVATMEQTNRLPVTVRLLDLAIASALAEELPILPLTQTP